jgi:hypothetical protein
MNMNSPADPLPSWLILLIPVIFSIFFIALWCGICLLLSVISGWRGLAAKYPGSPTPAGALFSMVSGSVGGVNYNNCLKVHVGPQGLHVAVWKIFGLGHPPIFIPWAEIRHAATRKFLFMENVVFEIGSPKIAKMRLPKRVFAGQPVDLDGQRGSSVPPPFP